MSVGSISGASAAQQIYQAQQQQAAAAQQKPAQTSQAPDTVQLSHAALKALGGGGGDADHDGDSH